MMKIKKDGNGKNPTLFFTQLYKKKRIIISQLKLAIYSKEQIYLGNSASFVISAIGDCS